MANLITIEFLFHGLQEALCLVGLHLYQEQLWDTCITAFTMKVLVLPIVNGLDLLLQRLHIMEVLLTLAFQNYIMEYKILNEKETNSKTNIHYCHRRTIL